MKIYLSTWSVHRLLFAGAISLESMPALSAACGFAGVELEDIFFRSSGEAYVKAIAGLLRRYGQKALIAVSNDFTVRAPRRLRAEIVKTKHFLRIASVFDSPVVRVLMGSMHPSVSSLEQVKEAMREVLEEARRLRLRVAIENHDRLSKNPFRLVNFVESFASPSVGICLDTGNFPRRDRYRAIQHCTPHALMVHAKAYAFRSDGEERALSYRRIGRILERDRFKGPVVVEYAGRGEELLGSVRVRHLIEKHLARPDWS